MIYKLEQSVNNKKNRVFSNEKVTLTLKFSFDHVKSKYTRSTLLKLTFFLRLAIESIEVRESDSESGAFQYVFRVQPPRQTNERSFAFLASFPFIKVEDNDFTMTRDITPDISFSGSGEEKILGNLCCFLRKRVININRKNGLRSRYLA